MGGETQKTRRDLGLLAAILFAARVVFLLQSADGPFFADLVMDERVHWDWAGTILEHGTLGEAFFRAPLFYYVLALFRLVSSDSIFVCRLLTSLAGVLTAMLVFTLTRKLTGRAWAWAAALLYGLGSGILFFDTRLLSDQLAALLMMLALYLMVEQRRPWQIGGVIGLASLARPLAVILVPLWLIWSLGSGEGVKKTARHLAVLTAVFLLTVAPATIVNWVESHDFVLIAWNGGVNFFIGNNPGSDGMTAVHPEFRKDWWGSYYDFIRFAERDVGESLKPSEVSSYWYRQGADFIIGEPVAALRLTGRKALLFFSGAEISNNFAITPYIEDVTPLFARLPDTMRLFMIPYAFCLVALVRERRRSAPTLLALYVLAYAAVNILFFVTSRYRLPALPALVIVGTHTVWLLRSDFKKHWYFLVAAAAFLPLVLFVNVPINYPAYFTAVGNAYLQRSELEHAETAFSRVLEYVDQYPQVAEGLAMVAEKRGASERAIALYERELAASGSDFASYRLAALLYDARRYDRAYHHSSRIWEKYEDAATLHAQICIAMGKIDEAERTLLVNIDKDYAVEESEYLLTMAYLLQGNPKAQQLLDRYRGNPRFDRLRQLQLRLQQERRPVDVQ
jgi:4-amino-4-deoxy-L-arabinose transferase-like glycosyltransferase